MLRLAEVALFLAPLGLLIAWWLASSRASQAVMWASMLLLIVVGGSVVYYGLERALPRDVAYVPARLEGGRIVPGHGAPPSSP
jgi:hypothetical protein